MPTNLPPDYFEVEKRYREAQSPAEKVALLEEMMRIVPKHKGTDHLRADLRRQISRLKEEAQSRKRQGGRQSVYQVEREGVGQAVVIGGINVGKSALVAALTNASPPVSEAPYTTRKPAPGMVPIEDIQVQMIDTPSLERDFAEGGLFDLIRHADLILLVVDIEADPLAQFEEALALLAERRIAPRQRVGQYPAEERFVYLPMIVLVNKCDDASQDDLVEVCRGLLGEEWDPLPVSAVTGRNLDELKRRAFALLEIVRVYSKPPGRPPDLAKPFVLKKGATVAELAGKIHRDFHQHLKYARVWGSAEFPGRMVQRDYVLQDGDVVELKI